MSCYNLAHNSLKLYNASVQIQFPTSKVQLNIYHNKLGTHIHSQVAEQLKT